MPEKKTFAVVSFSRVIQLAFWVLALGFILSLSAIVLPWPDAFYRALLTTICHLINFYFFYSYLIPRYFDKGKYVPVFFGSLLVILLITPLRMWLESLFVIDAPAFSTRVGSHARVGFVIFSEVTIAGFASLLRIAANQDKIKWQLKDMEKSQLETELRFLKAQMSPHFLFNSINNIYSLVLLKSDQAPQALMKLSSLLRYLLYECDHPVTIAREIEALKTYHDLFQLKFEEPLQLRWHIKVSNPARHIEPLLLVPLLENAFKHSGLGTEKTARVNFSIVANATTLEINTSNTISSVASRDENGGIGLANIKKRLERLFPNTHFIEITPSKDQFSLSLKIPLL